MTRSDPSSTKVFDAIARARAAGLPAAQRADADLKRRVRALPAGFFELGVALARFRAGRHALFLGHRTFQGYVDVLGLGRATAYKLLSIAAHLPRSRAMALGIERAYALSRIAARDPRAARNPKLDGLSSRDLRRPKGPTAAEAECRRIATRLARSGVEATTARVRGRWVIVLDPATGRALHARLT